MNENANVALANMTTQVINKAVQDPAFKAELLANPKAAVEKALNLELPEIAKLQVVQAPANTVVLVLPHVIETKAGGELSDDDLEAVAGGSKAGATKFFNDAATPFMNVGSVAAGFPMLVGMAGEQLSGKDSTKTSLGQATDKVTTACRL